MQTSYICSCELRPLFQVSSLSVTTESTRVAHPQFMSQVSEFLFEPTRPHQNAVDTRIGKILRQASAPSETSSQDATGLFQNYVGSHNARQDPTSLPKTVAETVSQNLQKSSNHDDENKMRNVAQWCYELDLSY